MLTQRLARHLGYVFVATAAMTMSVRSQSRSSHPATVYDIVSLVRPSSVQISPDGSHIAYVTTKASLKSNDDEAELHLCAFAGCTLVEPLARASRISAVQWYRDGQALSYVTDTSKGKQIWYSRLKAGEQKLLVELSGCGPWREHVETPLPYEISPDGNLLVYATYDCDQAARNEAADLSGGVIYTGEFVKPLSYLEYQRLPVNLWLLNIHSGATTKLWTAPTFGPLGFTLPEFRWSKDGGALALLYVQPGLSRYTLALLNLSSHAVEQLSVVLGFSRGLKWNDNGNLIVFYSEGELAPDAARGKGGIYTYRLSDHTLRELSADQETIRLSYQGTSNIAIKLAERLQQDKGILVSSCSVDSRAAHAACVQEAPTTPPEVVSLTLNHGEPTQSLTTLTHLNPAYDSIDLGQISRLTWKNSEGEGSAGLVLPVGFVPGRQYPLLVMLYNLYNGRTFIADAGGFTSYPVQTFAGAGYAILLMNVPRYYAFKPGDFATARRLGVDAVVDDIRSAVNIVAGRGYVDSTKMGIMGWSGGCFWTNYIVTHFPTWFHAAESGECAVHYPGQYWLGDDHWRKQEDDFFGGGPFGPFLSRWKEISPVLNADQLRIPLLMEYSGFYPAGLEMRTAILGQGGEAELIIYADDTHVLQRPLNRYNSMTRNLDWFNFWLRGIEDPNPKKTQQYSRWKAMRFHTASAKR